MRSREIKFRVWDKDLKSMHVLGDNIHDSMTFWENTACYYNLQNGEGSSPDGLGSYELMQYTGLKDKNGKEIYEGDIVKGYWWERGKSHRHIGRVTYVMNAFKVRGVKQYLGMDDELTPVYEVIGTVFENPELLEGESHE